MTTFDYAKSKATATRMLTRHGQSITITRHAIGAYDPATGTATDTTSTQSGIGVIFEWGQQGSTPSYGKSMIDKSLIIEGDKQLYLSATGITIPNINDNITDKNGKVYMIKMIKELAPSGTAVLYECNICGV
jgi:hypothetical protein